MVKRSFDICLSLLSLIMLVLPCLVIAVLIKAGSSGPICAGHKNRQRCSPFNTKFRSMH